MTALFSFRMQARAAWSWSIPLLLAASLLMLLALTRLAIGLEAISEAPQLDYGEPIIYAQATRILNGEALYQPLDRPPYSVAAYTPVYYKLASQLQARVGPGFGPGRALSFAAGLASAAGVAWLTALYARSISAGAFAALVFIRLGFPGDVPWFALYRVDTLAEAFSVATIVVLAHRTTARHVLLASSLAALAILTKQNYVAATLAGTLWLWSVERRRAVLFAAAAILLVLGVCASLERSTGAFLTNAIAANVNPINLEQVPEFLGLLGQTLGVPLIIAAAYVGATRARQKSASRLPLLYWLASALPLLGLFKFGAAYNYWIELAGATAVLATAGLWSAVAWYRGGYLHNIWRGVRWIFAANLALLAPASTAATANRLTDGVSLTGIQPATRAEFHELVAYVRSQPGEVLADPLDELVLGGRPVLMEPVVFALMEQQAQWDSEPIVRRVCSGDVSLLVLGAPLDVVARFAPNGEPWWPPRVMRALVERMRPAGERAGRFLYVPSDTLHASDTSPPHECAG